MRIKLLSLFCGAALGLSFSAAADVNGDMNNFFNKLGFASNTSQPQVWQGQAAGYASGGSLYARTQVKTIQLVSMTLPDINMRLRRHRCVPGVVLLYQQRAAAALWQTNYVQRRGLLL